MAATNTGTDDINLAPENDDFDDANVDVHANDDDSGDATGQGNINSWLPRLPEEQTDRRTSTSEWSRTRFRNSLVPKARTPFPLRISSDD